MSKLVFDCTMETMYPLAKEGFSGGSQVYVRSIVSGLASRGHQVHVIAPDAEVDEQRGPNEWWWPPSNHPYQFDIAIQQMHANPNPDYDADHLILMTSCIDPNLGPNHQFGTSYDAFPVFSQVHKNLLLKMRPTILPEKVHITGLGVKLSDYPYTAKVPGRLLYANDPARGLFYMLDIFDKVRAEVPYTTLHVAYDFNTQLSWRMWDHSQLAEMLLDCRKRIDNTPGVVNRTGLTRTQIIQEELECQVHCMPSDPPGEGTQTHGITQMECAAACCALVLSDVEAFPEVFGDAAIILPTIGRFIPKQERRVCAEDYASVVIELIGDKQKWGDTSVRCRQLAEDNTWNDVLDRWESMLEAICA